MTDGVDRLMVMNVVRICPALKWLGFVSSPRFGLLQDDSLWLESEEAEVLSVELDLTDRTDGTDTSGGSDLGLATTPTEAELLHSVWQYHTQVIQIKPRDVFIILMVSN